MKKALIVTLIIIVASIVGYFVYTELTVKELFYVSSVENDDGKGRYSVKRLYSSDVDMEAFNAKVEKLISLEFTEEEIMAAALESGTPEFYPAFHILTYRPLANEKEVVIDFAAVQELAEGQKSAEFCMSDIHLEVMTTGVAVKAIDAHSSDILDRVVRETVLKNEAGTALSFDLGDYGDAKLTLDGTSGTVTIQCSYGIKKNSLIKHTAMENCFILMTVNFTEETDGKITVSYSSAPATTVDEYIEQ